MIMINKKFIVFLAIRFELIVYLFNNFFIYFFNSELKLYACKDININSVFNLKTIKLEKIYHMG